MDWCEQADNSHSQLDEHPEPNCHSQPPAAPTCAVQGPASWDLHRPLPLPLHWWHCGCSPWQCHRPQLMAPPPLVSVVMAGRWAGGLQCAGDAAAAGCRLPPPPPPVAEGSGSVCFSWPAEPHLSTAAQVQHLLTGAGSANVPVGWPLPHGPVRRGCPAAGAPAPARWPRWPPRPERTARVSCLGKEAWQQGLQRGGWQKPAEGSGGRQAAGDGSWAQLGCGRPAVTLSRFCDSPSTRRSVASRSSATEQAKASMRPSSSPWPSMVIGEAWQCRAASGEADGRGPRLNGGSGRAAAWGRLGVIGRWGDMRDTHRLFLFLLAVQHHAWNSPTKYAI